MSVVSDSWQIWDKVSITWLQVFVTNYTCDGEDKLIREARKSFVSGHASFSFYCATFLIIYLQTRLNPDPRWVRMIQ